MVQRTVVVEGEMTDGGTAPCPEEVRAQLHRINSSPHFDASARNRRFLHFVVEETLAGGASRIKAYSIALAVFDRRDDFDPLTDPIVRIEASRLRRAIEHYYLTAGKDDRVRINMPKGTYVPVFSVAVHDDNVLPSQTQGAAQDFNGHSSAASPQDDPRRPRAIDIIRTRPFIGLALTLTLVFCAAMAGLVFHATTRSSPQMLGGPRAPSIMVMPFAYVGSDPTKEYVATGMTYEVIAQLTRFEDLFVYRPHSSAEGNSNGETRAISPDYVLSGSIQTSGQSLRVNALLTDEKTSQSVWSWTTEESLSPAHILTITRSVSQRIVNMVAQSDGVILERYQKAIARKPALELMSYECVVDFRDYWRGYRRERFAEIEACLERTISQDPEYAPAYSSLALMHVDRHRFGFGGGDKDNTALETAIELAEKASKLEPQSSHPYLALSLAYWFQRKIDLSISMAERGLALNPNNVEQMADLGLRYALLGRWEKALQLTNEAYERDPATPSGYHVAYFLYHYMNGDYAQALAAAEQVGAHHTIYGHIAKAAAAGQLGDIAKGRASVADILTIDPQYGSHARADLAKRNMAAPMIDSLVVGLEKAGLSINSN
jgi:adenylate cyclase